MVGRGAQREEMLWVKIRDFRCSYLVQKVFKFLLHNSHDFFMFYGYHITINRKTSDTDAAYKIFFIILELISDYQLSSLFITNKAGAISRHLLSSFSSLSIFLSYRIQI